MPGGGPQIPGGFSGPCGPPGAPQISRGCSGPCSPLGAPRIPMAAPAPPHQPRSSARCTRSCLGFIFNVFSAFFAIKQPKSPRSCLRLAPWCSRCELGEGAQCPNLWPQLGVGDSFSPGRGRALQWHSVPPKSPQSPVGPPQQGNWGHKGGLGVSRGGDKGHRCPSSALWGQILPGFGHQRLLRGDPQPPAPMGAARAHGVAPAGGAEPMGARGLSHGKGVGGGVLRVPGGGPCSAGCCGAERCPKTQHPWGQLAVGAPVHVLQPCTNNSAPPPPRHPRWRRSKRRATEGQDLFFCTVPTLNSTRRAQ